MCIDDVIYFTVPNNVVSQIQGRTNSDIFVATKNNKIEQKTTKIQQKTSLFHLGQICFTISLNRRISECQ